MIADPGELIGIGGWKASGKDAIADHLVADHGWVKLGMSDLIWQCALTLNPIIDTGRIAVPLTDGSSVGLQQHMRLQSIDRLCGFVTAKTIPDVRALLQRLGTDMGRDLIGDDVWVSATRERIESLLADGHRLAVTGIRFPNELAMIRLIGGRTLWVDRPGTAHAGPGAHASEVTLNAAHFSSVIVNDGTLEDLYQQVAEWLESVRLPIHTVLESPDLPLPERNTMSTTPIGGTPNTSLDHDWFKILSEKGTLFGVTDENTPVLFDHDTTGAVLISGGAGSGKSVTLRSILVSAALAEHEIHLVTAQNDPTFKETFAPYAESLVAVDSGAAVQTLETVYDIMCKRKEILATTPPELIRELHQQHVFLAIDELARFVTPELIPSWATLSEGQGYQAKSRNETRARVREILGHLLQETEPVGITVVVTSQDLAGTFEKFPEFEGVVDGAFQILQDKSTAVAADGTKQKFISWYNRDAGDRLEELRSDQQKADFVANSLAETPGR